jgi:hypothetical protein
LSDRRQNRANSVAHNDSDRRRFLLASAMTLLALPALWWANKQSDAGAPNVATVGIEVADANDSGANADAAAVIAPVDATGAIPTTTIPVVSTTPTPTTTPPVTEPPPVFLGGPSASGAVAAPPIGIPASPAVATITTKATYRSTISPADTCLVAGIDTGTRITVTNLDNGHSVDCIANRVYTDGSDGLVLHTNLFAQIADLTDAPIPVDITS